MQDKPKLDFSNGLWKTSTGEYLFVNKYDPALKAWRALWEDKRGVKIHILLNDNGECITSNFESSIGKLMIRRRGEEVI